MLEGILWLPLLGVFGWLFWAGRQEYGRREAYRSWAESFERHSYDRRVLVGQQGDRLIWAQPTTAVPQVLHTVPLSQLLEVQLLIDGNPWECPDDILPLQVRDVRLILGDRDGQRWEIAFEDKAIARNWWVYVRSQIHAVP
ncbi:MAG: hypothetical protein HC919_03695 [Oscillatoriales cyanobacterium SM2_2_1]|nr:hypothetical protein [Oscillatoriales cyanobacterium SM2_2_1]